MAVVPNLWYHQTTTCPQNGVVQGRVFQPHEAHVPFVLQFLMDHNLHGMNMIHLQSCRFRQLPGEALEVSKGKLKVVGHFMSLEMMQPSIKFFNVCAT
ncbi:DNA polymerase zeta catalytic subunit [Portunus trituberculatus]|uniref:DNA polymerase zeta catalytic subunit n=1 Tax=Portunus trituberculatus TaxID=210409 RepID=A0A5B7CIG7_PORTR|nr:DNA polymerase zeta catalytic subunit [Portunus trituberculatus]